MNLPNKITISRIVLTVLFLFFLSMPGAVNKLLALVIFVLASFTDYLDGWIAKKNDLVTDFGKIMDPVADKTLTISAFVAFAFMGVVPWFIVLVIVIREFFVTGWRLKALIQGKVFAASSAGKKKTVSQIVAIFLALIFVLMREIEYKSVPFLTGEKEILCEHILFL